MPRRSPSRVASPAVVEADAVLYAKQGAVATVTLNRPHMLNAYNVAMRDGLFSALQAVRDDPEIRAVVLCGNGPAFCTGGDLHEFGSARSPSAARAARWQRDVWGLLLSLPQITIAAVHGYVVGGGLEMALLCDICISAADARFSYPETALGMIPGVGGTQTTARRVGIGQGLDLVLTGRWFDAGTAVRLGIALRSVPRPRLRSTTTQLARQYARLSPQLVAGLKRCVAAAQDLDLGAGLALEKRLAEISRAQSACTRRSAGEYVQLRQHSSVDVRGSGDSRF